MILAVWKSTTDQILLNKNLSKILPLSTSLIALFLFFGCGQKETISGKIPAISFKSYAGETVTVSPEDKQVTLLVFWATWCQPCLMEIPALIILHEKYHKQNFRVVSVNVDDPDGQKVMAIQRSYAIEYPLVIGSEAVMKQYGGVVALPTAFLIGKNGTIIEKLQGLHSEEALDKLVTTALAALD